MNFCLFSGPFTGSINHEIDCNFPIYSRVARGKMLTLKKLTSLFRLLENFIEDRFTMGFHLLVLSLLFFFEETRIKTCVCFLLTGRFILRQKPCSLIRPIPKLSQVMSFKDVS